VVAADQNDGVMQYEDHNVAVSTHDRLTAGQTVTDNRSVLGREPNTAVAVDIDVERYQSIVLDRLRSLADAVA
jgi:inosine-uridine nucleoside N-ribohydrolase